MFLVVHALLQDTTKLHQKAKEKCKAKMKIKRNTTKQTKDIPCCSKNLAWVGPLHAQDSPHHHR